MNKLFSKIHDSLPLFLINDGGYSFLYTPGFSQQIKTMGEQELIKAFKNPGEIENTSFRNIIINSLEKAQEAKSRWEMQKHIPFSPECLTIHVGNDCNLNCTYCYSKKEETLNKRITGFPAMDAIEALCESSIKEICITGSQSLTVVFHGSGEPTYHWEKLIAAHNIISETARKNGMHLFTYLATNGCLRDEQTDWLAKNINLIGISCDGPRTIHQKQRGSGYPQNQSIDYVCKQIRKKGGRFDIRVTLTRESIQQLEEITRYLIEKCLATNIRVEPVYLAGENAFKKEDAEEFFVRFTEAKKYAGQNNVSFSYSGVRMSELHGPYCDVLRNTLRLTSDGLTRNCFCFMSEKEEFITGQYNIEPLGFQINQDIMKLKKKALTFPDECSECINIYHCSRGCPDFCIYENGFSARSKLNPFRCLLHQLLTVESIKESIEKKQPIRNP